MGEPATQMTLKTFHFAGVASMNVTLGVPRIKEIINAAKAISTPIMEAALETNSSEVSARFVKGRIEKTTLGEVARSITEVHVSGLSCLEVRVDMDAIRKLQLEVDLNAIAACIAAAPKLNLKDVVQVAGDDVIVVRAPKKRPGRALRKTKVTVPTPADLANAHERGAAHLALQVLKSRLPGIIVCGIPTVSRAVITEDEAATKRDGERRFQLLVEGEGLLAVMGMPGVDARRTVSNHVAEVERVLGIEAARVMIMRELNKTYGSYGIDIDPRHLMLLADVMTYRGEVLGITRFGIAKMKDSVVMLASFEKTPDHLFDAAVHSRQDFINGVSECIVVGRPCGLGTGAFKLGLEVQAVGRALGRPDRSARAPSSAALEDDPAASPLRSALRRRSSSVASEADFGAAPAEAEPASGRRRAAPKTFRLGRYLCSALPRPPVPIMTPSAAGACPKAPPRASSDGADDDVLLDLPPSRAGLGLRSSSASSSASSAAGGPDVPRRVTLARPVPQRSRTMSSASSSSSLPPPAIPNAAALTAVGHPKPEARLTPSSSSSSSGFGLPVVPTAASMQASAAAAEAALAARSAAGRAAGKAVLGDEEEEDDEEDGDDEEADDEERKEADADAKPAVPQRSRRASRAAKAPTPTEEDDEDEDDVPARPRRTRRGRS